LTGHSSNYEEFEKRYYNKIVKYATENIIVHSQEAKITLVTEYNIENYSDKVVPIPHGNFISYYQNTISQEESRDILDINPDEFVYLFLGNISEYKNLPALISEFKNLEIHKGKLVIAGRPSQEELEEKVIEMCSDNSNIDTYLYFIPDDEIQIYMNAADVVVLPYEKILTSGSAILSMSFGKPVIAPDKGCLKDFLPESSNFKYHKNHELEDKMLEAYKSGDVLGEYGKENLSHVSHYGWDKIAEKTKKVYNNT
jgi:glycosyltransferase involved in cell wall biosynthesis